MISTSNKQVNYVQDAMGHCNRRKYDQCIVFLLIHDESLQNITPSGLLRMGEVSWLRKVCLLVVHGINRDVQEQARESLRQFLADVISPPPNGNLITVHCLVMTKCIN